MSNHTGASVIEQGWKSDLEIFNGEVIKTTRETFSSPEEAALTISGLEAYSDELAAQSIRVAQLRNTDILTVDDGYRVRHTYELINGNSLIRLDEDQRQSAVYDTLSQISQMDTLGGEDTLRTPIDARAENFHLDKNNQPTLTDIYPALTRHPDGSFPLDAVGEQKLGRLSALSWMMSKKSAVMSRLLMTTADQGNTDGGFTRHVGANLDWCYDSLPGELDPRVRDKIRRQIDLNFVPFLGRSAVSRHAIRLLDRS